MPKSKAVRLLRSKTRGGDDEDAGVIFLPIPAENQPGLIAVLEGDPFVGHALNSATCELYDRNGTWLAPLTAALSTMKHCRFGHCRPVHINNVGEGGEPRDRDGVSREASTESESHGPEANLRIRKKWQLGVPALPLVP